MAHDYDRNRQAARAIPIDKFDLMVLAAQIVRELPKHLRALGRAKEEWDSPLVSLRGFNEWHYTLSDFEVQDVRGQLVKVPVYVAAAASPPTRARTWISGGLVHVRYDAQASITRKSYMLVQVNGTATINGLMANLNAVEKEVYSVLIHEVTHLKDHFPARALRNPDGNSLDTEPSLKGYYNNSAEVRAFMQQVVDEVLDHAASRTRDIGSLTSGFIERALETSATWNRIRPHLTAENERLVRKAVARALHDEWPRSKARAAP